VGLIAPNRSARAMIFARLGGCRGCPGSFREMFFLSGKRKSTPPNYFPAEGGDWLVRVVPKNTDCWSWTGGFRKELYVRLPGVGSQRSADNRYHNHRTALQSVNLIDLTLAFISTG